MTIQLHQGDCLKLLQQMPNESVQCCVTSPPYWGLRDYGVSGQLGLEKTPEEYVAKMVEVFREVRRVLADDGTLWLNLGDSYAGSGKGPPGNFSKNSAAGKARHLEKKTGGIVPVGLKPKDLVGIPWRVAFALQADGWYLRQDIIWHKPNPMPESVTDRFTKNYEDIFLLAKSSKYFFDNEAVKEPTVTKDTSIRNRDATRLNNTPGRSKMSGLKNNNYDKRNRRNVWQINTRPFKGAHFAVFPPELPEICIKAGTKEGDTVLDPFSGSGTVGMVAKRHNRNFIGLELNADYIEIAKRRIESEPKQLL